MHRFIPPRLILFSCGSLSWSAVFCSSSVVFWAFWNFGGFEERGQICFLLVSWEWYRKLWWYSIRFLEMIFRLTFLEIVIAEVTNPPGFHVEVGQRCLVGRAEAAKWIAIAWWPDDLMSRWPDGHMQQCFTIQCYALSKGKFTQKTDMIIRR